MQRKYLNFIETKTEYNIGKCKYIKWRLRIVDILVVTDNEYIYNKFNQLIQNVEFSKYNFYFTYSYNNAALKEKYQDNDNFGCMNVKEQAKEIIEKFDLVISLHCKQIFPKELVKSKRCINVHPGLNPHNRGWFPQVFSILNKKPVGVTIHEIDEQLDHGAIIVQEEIELNSWDTSKSVYDRILFKEIELLNKYLKDIIEKNYEANSNIEEGNINYLKDFKKLCELDLNEKVTMGEAIDRLRALTFDGYKNAYFFDESGNKVWISIQLEKES
jgi:methionyl-tRNA formyltransferase